MSATVDPSATCTASMIWSGFCHSARSGRSSSPRSSAGTAGHAAAAASAGFGRWRVWRVGRRRANATHHDQRSERVLTMVFSRDARPRHRFRREDAIELPRVQQPALEHELANRAPGAHRRLGDLGGLRVADVRAQRRGDRACCDRAARGSAPSSASMPSTVRVRRAYSSRCAGWSTSEARSTRSPASSR